MSEAENPKPDQSTVGYRRPPVEKRFKKGVSGNPRGRPRKKRAGAVETSGDARLSHLIIEEAYRPIQIRENGRTEELPMIQAILRSLGVAAAKGSHRAQIAITTLVQAVEQRRLNEKQALFETAIGYKDHWNEVIADHKRRGVAPPEPVPHPDDIAIDTLTGDVLFNGPRDEFEKAEWDKLLERKAEATREIEESKNDMKRSRKYKEFYKRMIESEQKIHDRIATLVPDAETRRTPGFDLGKWQERQAKLAELRESWRRQREPAK